MFNKFSRENSQEVHKLKLALEELKGKFDRIEGLMRSSQLEIADYYEKTRRLYLRMSRREKVDSEEPSEPSPQAPDQATTAGREEILRRYKRGQA